MNTAKFLKARADIDRRVAKLQASALREIVALARPAGITATEIAQALAAAPSGGASSGGTRRSSLAGRKVAPKYRNPADASQTWTGRGVAPKWAAELKKAGQLDKALIA